MLISPPTPHAETATPPEQVLLNLLHAGLRPAALIGDWFGADAIIAPHVDTHIVAPEQLFPTTPDETAGATGAGAGVVGAGGAGAGGLGTDNVGGAADNTEPWFFGARPYEGASFGGWCPSVLVLRDGTWHTDDVDPDIVHTAFTGTTSSDSEAAHDTSDLHILAPHIEWNRGDEAAHELGVHSCHEAIRAGEVYQACLSTRFYGRTSWPVTGTANSPRSVGTADSTHTVDTAHSPHSVSTGTLATPVSPEPSLFAAAHWFADKVRRHSPARGVFLPGNPSQSVPSIASLSPEEFLIRSGTTVTETPIKGTLPLSARPEELLASEKDVAENIMIVDLVRHDLGQIAVTGGVRVTDLLSVRPAPGVWHLFSTVAAEIPRSLPHSAVIDACFPPASVTGTPKLRAAELIDEWEPVSRGVHCGCIGASVGDAMELNVAIRTAEFYDADTLNSGAVCVELGVGGGITIDSNPATEWAEINDKAAPLL